jgi:hypothetical protein
MDNSTLQTGAIAEAAVQPDLNVQQTGAQAQQEPQMVPVTALQAERRERQQLQENLKLLQDHVSLLQAQKPKQQEPDALDSLSDNDVLTVGEAKKFIQNFSREQKLAVEELKMSQTHPDYNEVVRKYLPDVLKNDPELKDVITNAPNPYKAAYHLAKRSDSYLQDQREKQRSPEAQKAVQNLSRAGNLSSVGHSSSGVPGSNYKTMSDADFMKTVNKNLGYS